MVVLLPAAAASLHTSQEKQQPMHPALQKYNSQTITAHGHQVTVSTQLKMIANAANTPNEAMGMIGALAVATNARKVVAEVLRTVTNVREYVYSMRCSNVFIWLRLPGRGVWVWVGGGKGVER